MCGTEWVVQHYVLYYTATRFRVTGLTKVRLNLGSAESRGTLILIVWRGVRGGVRNDIGVPAGSQLC